MTQAELPIKVGDKVRVVSSRGHSRHGHVGVFSAEGTLPAIGCVSFDERTGLICARCELALYADELEDMPNDTVTVDHEGLFQTADNHYCTDSEECIQLMVQLHNDCESP